MCWTKIPNSIDTALRGRKRRTTPMLSVYESQAYLSLPGWEVGRVDIFYNEALRCIAVEPNENGGFSLNSQGRARTVRLRVPNWLFPKLDLPVGRYELDSRAIDDRIVFALPEASAQDA